MLHRGSFLNELKRRKVVRAAVVYAGVAWLVVEVASVVVPALHLPAWTLTFIVLVAILGFPLVLALEWVFEVTSAGVRRTSSRETRETGHSLLLRPAVIVVIIALAVGFGAWRLWSDEPIDGRAAAPVSETRLAVLPFDIRGPADLQYLREGMVDLLATRLGGTAAVRPLDPRTVLSFVTREGLDASQPDVARRVSRRFGAGRFLQGSVVEHGGRLQVRASVHGLEQAEPLIEAAAEGEADELFALVDDLAAEILAGTSGRSAGRLTGLAALTTDSLRALKAYLEGEAAYRRGRWDEAIGGYEDAVAIDSTFALAYHRLASAAGWAERAETSEVALEAALRYADRLAPRDRKLVHGHAAWRRGSHVEAARLNREIVESHPETVEGWYQLGEVLSHEGYLHGADPRAAEESFRRAAELDPDLYPALQHLRDLIRTLAGPTEELESTTARILRLNPDDVTAPRWPILDAGTEAARDSLLGVIEETGSPFSLIYYTYFSPTPDVGERIAAALTAPRHSRAWRAIGHALVAQSRAAGGRWRDARAAMARLEELDRPLGLELRGHLALVAPKIVAARELEPLRTALLEWDGTGGEPPSTVRGFSAPHAGLHPYLRLYLLGLVEARTGRTESARQRADALTATDPSAELVAYVDDLAVIVQAEAARAEGDPGRALAVLEDASLWTEHPLDERISPLVAHKYPVFLRAELLREAGRAHEALRWYEAMSPQPRLPPTTLALLRRARIHDTLGEPERAEELYRDVAKRWTDPDPELRGILRELPG